MTACLGAIHDPTTVEDWYGRYPREVGRVVKGNGGAFMANVTTLEDGLQNLEILIGERVSIVVGDAHDLKVAGVVPDPDPQ